MSEPTVPSPGRGGRRPGAGRPKKSEQRQSAEKCVMTAIDKILAQMRDIGITEDLLREGAMRGLASLFYHARRGNLKASIYLVDRLIGKPDAPFAEKVQELDQDEVEVQLLTAFRKAGFEPVTCRKIVDVLIAMDAEPEMAGLLDQADNMETGYAYSKADSPDPSQELEEDDEE